MYFEDILEEEKEEARAIGLAEGKAKGLAEGRAEGKNEGLAEGRAEGRNETKITNAKAFIQLGKLTLEDIAKCCELPLEQVQKLAEEIKK